jgi:hypothetical protein
MVVFILFLKGSPSDTFDLLRAGAMQAKLILIVSRDFYNEKGRNKSNELEETITHDAISLMIYRLLEFSPTFPIIQLGTFTLLISLFLDTLVS